MKAVITVLGKDSVGILALVSQECAKVRANVTDVTQSIMQDMFAMIMMVDLSGCTVPFNEFADSLTRLGEKNGLKIHTMNEEIFNCMHKI